jgi:hypothetical protein
VPSGGRNDLLSQIHQGMSLKPVQTNEDSGSGDGRGGLLEAIRKGTSLRPVWISLFSDCNCIGLPYNHNVTYTNIGNPNELSVF